MSEQTKSIERGLEKICKQNKTQKLKKKKSHLARREQG